jgi:hypothetical protein
MKIIPNMTKRKGIAIFMAVCIILILIEGCTAQGRYRKHKAIPCPCETERRS